MCGQCQQEIAHVVPCSGLAGYTQRSSVIRMNFLNPTPDGCMTGPFRTVRLPKRTWRLRQGRTALARREVWLGGRTFPNRTGPRRAGPGEACVRANSYGSARTCTAPGCFWGAIVTRTFCKDAHKDLQPCRGTVTCHPYLSVGLPCQASFGPVLAISEMQNGR